MAGSPAAMGFWSMHRPRISGARLPDKGFHFEIFRSSCVRAFVLRRGIRRVRKSCTVSRYNNRELVVIAERGRVGGREAGEPYVTVTQPARKPYTGGGTQRMNAVVE